ncbi:MAG TPA: FHA domain-containing protein, partial [Kofleriaceae bacterium]
MARLIFRDSQGREGTVELSPTETVFVGRGLECAIRTDDGMVSRRHAQFRMENGRFVVEDLGSANGTHLNNTRIQKQAVGHADIIQCGSLVIRFVDEGGVNVVSQQGQVNMGAGMGQPPPKKGGTMVLDRGDAPPLMGGGPSSGVGNGFPPPSQSSPFPPPSQQQPSPFGAPPSMPSQFGSNPGSQPNALPYGGPPGMPAGQNAGGSFGGSRGGFGGSAGAASIGTAGTLAQGQPFSGPPAMPAPVASPNLPYGGPPGMPNAMPAGSGQAPAPGMPFGGPPAMPAGGQGNASIFGRGGPVSAPQTRGPADPEKKVLVDLGLEYDPNKASGELKQIKVELEKANANYEREVADGKRIRAESATLRDRIEELKAAVKDREEQSAAHDRVSDQLREELQQTRDEHNKVRQEMGEM